MQTRAASACSFSTPRLSDISEAVRVVLWVEYRECVCVCVFFQFILYIKFVGRTSRGHTGGRSHRISHPPSFCGACLNFCREKDSGIPFPRRPCSRILCTNDSIVLHLLGYFFVILFIFSEKNPVYRDRTHDPTCQKVTRLPLSYRGDRLHTSLLLWFLGNCAAFRNGHNSIYRHT